MSNMFTQYLTVVTYRIDHETIAIRGTFKTESLASAAIAVMAQEDHASINDFDTYTMEVNKMVDIAV